MLYQSNAYVSIYIYMYTIYDTRTADEEREGRRRRKWHKRARCRGKSELIAPAGAPTLDRWHGFLGSPVVVYILLVYRWSSIFTFDWTTAPAITINFLL